MIGLILKMLLGSVLALCMPNDASNVLFLIFCAGNRLKQGKTNNKY